MVGIGDTIVGISLSTSAIEPTYGVAAHSLVLLSSYLFSFGFIFQQYQYLMIFL